MNGNQQFYHDVTAIVDDIFLSAASTSASHFNPTANSSSSSSSIRPPLSSSSVPPVPATFSTQHQQHHSPPPQPSLRELQKQAVLLLAQGQHKSCELVLRLDLSKQQSSASSGAAAAVSCHILAECLVAQGQHGAAAELYKDLFLHGPVRYRYKLAACLAKMGSLIEAVCVLEEALMLLGQEQQQQEFLSTATTSSTSEAVVEGEEEKQQQQKQQPSPPPKCSSSSSSSLLAVHMLLGDLYLRTSRKHDAQKMYKAALQHNPYALEAVYALAALGSNGVDLPSGNFSATATIANKTSAAAMMNAIDSSSSNNANNAASSTLAQELSLVLCAKQRHQTALALQLAQAMSLEYPDNVPLLLIQAELYQHQTTNNDNSAAAMDMYGRIRQLEPTQMDNMDQYANLLGASGRMHQLSDLTDSMLALNDKSPVAWTCLALYHKYSTAKASSSSKAQQALRLVDKALALDPHHAYAHYIRGCLLQEDHRPEYAAVSFFRSNEIQPTVAGYEGLVDAYLAARKDREAAAAAKEAWNLAPRDPRTLTLIGMGLSGTTHAKRSLAKALQLSPALKRPLLCLYRLLLEEKAYAAAIGILQPALEASLSGIDSQQYQHQQQQPAEGSTMIACPSDILCRMGECYTHLEQYREAVEVYSRALAANPECEGAVTALDRLDKLMRGLDPNDTGDDIAVEENVSADAAATAATSGHEGGSLDSPAASAVAAPSF
jgi:tetratricopeptide (TPR) repeat protein